MCETYLAILPKNVFIKSFVSLNTIHKSAIRLLKDPNLTAHRRSISTFSLFYKYYNGTCSDELKSIIPPKSVLRIARVSTNSFTITLIPMTSMCWNFFPAYIFFKPSTRVCLHTLTRSLSFPLFGNLSFKTYKSIYLH